MKITDITPQVHNKERRSIFVDGKYAFSLDEIDCIKLKIGDSISKSEMDRLNVESNLSKAKSKALDYLSRSPHTKHDLISKLTDKGYDKQIAELATSELEEMGLIDDREYASLYVEVATEKCYGSAKIRYELNHHGVPSDIIAEIMDSYEGVCTDELVQLLYQKYRNCDFGDIKVKQRAVRYLASRGFDFDKINEAIRCIKDKK